MLRAPLLLIALIGCTRHADPPPPKLFVDPGRVDLAVDVPTEDWRTAELTVSNVGGRAAELDGIEITGDHASLVAIDGVPQADLGPGEVIHLTARLVGTGDAATAPFHEDLLLTVFGTDPDPGINDGDSDADELSAEALIGIGTLWGCDQDGDGALAEVCEGPDCDDASADVGPDVAETCNGSDDDCDGDTDEDEAIDAPLWFPDADRDSYGDDATAAFACAAPFGAVERGGDCDDVEPFVNPDVLERCNGRDDDCDGTIDEDDAKDATVFHRDADGDQHGTGGADVRACELPSGYARGLGDCDDTRADVHVDAAERCDGVDNDCDGTSDDDAIDRIDVFTDADGDHHGNPAQRKTACLVGTGFAAVGDDCDDTDGKRFPGAPEICDHLDQDCDGTADDGLSTLTWHPDVDGDRFGVTAVSVVDCERPANHVLAVGDCDDVDASVHPGASELCDGRDQDCDGTLDEDATDGTAWHVDADQDSFGGPGTVIACTAPPGTTKDATDCDDADPAINPTATETCNGKDDDCDAVIDDGLGSTGTWFMDADSDKFGDKNAPVTACAQPPDAVVDNTDCDDTKAFVHPGATELCNGKDDDCDGAVDDGAASTTYYADADLDTFGDPANQTTACVAPPGFVADNTDCDDTDAQIHPSATEQCNGVDDNCDGSIDEDGGATTWFADADLDGYGDPNVAIDDCVPPPGFVDDAQDCDDTDASVNPDAIDSCVDGRDRNCDGTFEGCDGCHAFEPIDQVGWTRTYRVRYEGSTGTEVQDGLGATFTPDGRPAFAVHSVMSAGPRSWDVDQLASCDPGGVLYQEGMSGTSTDPDYGLFGSITFTSSNRPPRQVLPPASTFGTGTAWTFSYSMDVTVDPGIPVSVPTDGNGRDMGLEVVTVPAGSFIAWRIDTRWNQDNSQWGGSQDRRRSTFWYTEGLGLVREDTTDRATGAIVMRKELVSYSGLTPLP